MSLVRFKLGHGDVACRCKTKRAGSTGRMKPDAGVEAMAPGVDLETNGVIIEPLFELESNEAR